MTLGSLGKTFSAVGWRCGFGIGPEYLIKSIKQATSCINYTSDTLTQLAFSEGLKLADEPHRGFDSYFKFASNTFEQNRNYICENIHKTKVNWKTFAAEGGWFQFFDITDEVSKIPKKYFYANYVGLDGDKSIGCAFEELENPDFTPDFAFNTYSIDKFGVGFVPGSAFYNNEGHSAFTTKGRHFIRTKLCA